VGEGDVVPSLEACGRERGNTTLPISSIEGGLRTGKKVPCERTVRVSVELARTHRREEKKRITQS